MVFAVRPERGFRWIFSGDRELEEERQTWFFLDTPDHATCTKLMDSIRMTGNLHQFAAGSRIDLLVRTCLVGIDPAHPMTDPDGGDPVHFDRNTPQKPGEIDRVLSRIPWDVKREISDELQSRVLVAVADVEKPEPSSEDS